MPKSTIVVAHHLPEDEAVNRVKALLSQAQEKYGGQISDVHEEWTGNDCQLSWKSMGMGVKAHFAVKPEAVEAVADLPVAFTMFRGKVEEIVKDRLAQALAPTPA